MSPRNGKIPPEVGIDRGAGSIAKASRSYGAGGLAIEDITAAESCSARRMCLTTQVADWIMNRWNCGGSSILSANKLGRPVDRRLECNVALCRYQDPS